MSYQEFTGRLDPAYLKTLKSILQDIDGLCASATGKSKKIKDATGNFKKGIEIYFCGLTAFSLLGNVENGNIKDDEFKETALLFRKLLSLEMTSYLNNERNIYLKVRFVFPYVYSTFFYSLIDAQVSGTRPLIKNTRPKYTFQPNPIMSIEEIMNSSAFRVQKSFLSSLVKIVKSNPQLVISRSAVDNNTLQIRFSPTAMPLCLLIINDTAFADPFLYAQKFDSTGPNQQYYHYPVLSFKKNDKLGKEHFSFLSNHFDFTWYNELSILCMDGSEFDLNHNCDGLQIARKPNEVKWDQKEQRIKDYMDYEKIPFSKTEIIFWRRNVELKFSSYVIQDWQQNLNEKTLNDIHLRTLKPGPDQSASLQIGRRSTGFYFNILIPSQDITICYDKSDAELLYMVILHYGFAEKMGKIPVMHKKHQVKGKIFTRLAQTLEVKLKSGEKYKPGKEFIESVLFDPKDNFSFRIKNITVDENVDSWSKDLNYPLHQKSYTHTPNKVIHILDYENNFQHPLK